MGEQDTISEAMSLLAKRRARKLTPEERQAIARKGGQATAGKPRKRRAKPQDKPTKP